MRSLYITEQVSLIALDLSLIFAARLQCEFPNLPEKSFCFSFFTGPVYRGSKRHPLVGEGALDESIGLNLRGEGAFFFFFQKIAYYIIGYRVGVDYKWAEDKRTKCRLAIKIKKFSGCDIPPLPP